MSNKHIVALSGGESSAIVGIEVARKFGIENLVLLNHDINPAIEPADVKRFKQEVADYIGVPITYANHPDWETETPISLCVKAKTWINPNGRTILCTNRIKTAPAFDWYEKNYQHGYYHYAEYQEAVIIEPDIVYFGFNANEPARITRRANMMGASGYKTDYPLALWTDRTIHSTAEIGIRPPLSYDKFKHANCIGCIKAGWQHWYIIYCEHPQVWQELLDGEESIGYPVHGFDFAEDKAEMFEKMKQANVPATEKIESGAFWALTRRLLARLPENANMTKKRTGKLDQIGIFDMPTVEESVECTGDCKL